VTELLWFLRGDTNIKFLVDNDCHIWDGDAYKRYLEHFVGYEDVPNKDWFIEQIKTDDEFAKKWGDLGPVYGKQWRAWGGYEKVPSGWNHGAVTSYKDVPKCDQIANLIHDLKTNPDSRRLMVSAWNADELGQMTLPPCHYGFQVYTRELSYEERCKVFQSTERFKEETREHIKELNIKIMNEANIPKRAISLMWNQRSVDTFLGLPFNIASYGLLLEIIAKEVNMVPDELIGNLGDAHLYSNHIEQAKEQIGRQMTWEEKVQWVLKNTDVELENLYITEEIYKETTPKHTRQPYPLPQLKLDDWYSTQGDANNSTDVIMNCLMGLNHGHITLKNYKSHPSIKAPLSN
jgi:thymidylate synthase